MTTRLLRRWKGHCPISFCYTLVDHAYQLRGQGALQTAPEDRKNVFGRIQDQRRTATRCDDALTQFSDTRDERNRAEPREFLPDSKHPSSNKNLVLGGAAGED
jgi:hypothetical protein